MDNKSSDRLIEYYTRIMDGAGKEYNKEQLKKIVKRIAPEDVPKIIEAETFQQQQMNRLITYYTKLNALQIKQADDMEKLLKTVGDYDYTNENTVEINGNTFVCENGFPIEEYRVELERIGDSEKGEEYSVQLLDGKLVIY